MPTGKNSNARGGRGPQPPLAGPKTFDGPADDRGRSRSASRTRTRSQSATRPEARPDRIRGLLKNVDLGGEAYKQLNDLDVSLKRRGPFGKLGRAVKIGINSHVVQEWPDKTVYQYDILVGSGAEKRALIQKVWATDAIKQATGQGFIFDGNKIGWSLSSLKSPTRIEVDMDKAQKRQPKKMKNGELRPDIVPVQIKSAGKVNLATLTGYLDQKMDFSKEVLESINFLDHLLRENPSKTLTNVKRSYFKAMQPQGSPQAFGLGAGVEAIKGVYQSLRLGEGKKLVINADVANVVFFCQTSFDQLAMNMLQTPPMHFERATRWFPNSDKAPHTWETFKRFKGCNLYVKHKGLSQSVPKKAMQILFKSAETYKFTWNNKAAGTSREVSVKQYFHEKYNVYLNCPWLPLIEVRKNEVYPMEVCYMAHGQPYKAKLNEEQTSKMIKFAATRPNIRKEGIRAGLAQLDWGNDPFLRNYGMKIDPNMLQTNARILEPPEVAFGKGGSAKPMFSGRWDLRGKMFTAPNPQPLKSWGVLILKGTEGGDERAAPSKDEVKLFIQNFLKIYKGHGGIVANNTPYITDGIGDTAEAARIAFTNAGNQSKMRPQIMIVILTNKSSDVYGRVKMNLDCRFGVMSQCVLAGQIKKNSPQYCSNVLMKFNLKLGGTTSNVKARKPYFTEPTMIIGADVSHASPGMTSPSISAITVSMDRTCSRFAAAVQTNGYRVELITQRNIIEGLKPLIARWMETVGGGRLPKHVYYFRDGVSEGQFINLLHTELADVKKAFDIKADGHKEFMPKFTTVVCEKRHHIRFFPSQGPASDKNGNPVPGTIVDHDVTHPFEEDFYLNSHSAIQGTARPTHYHMLKDEYGVSMDTFQTMLYEHCYQYQRATTPVSLFPAVYYADLAALRGHTHIDKSAQTSWVEKHLNRENPGMTLPNFQGNVTFPPDLKPMEPSNLIHYGMWYI